MSDTPRQIVVLGPGAVGQALVSIIDQAGLPVRATGIDAPWSGQIVVQSPRGLHKTDLSASGTAASTIAGASMILITERANQLERALRLVCTRAMRETPVVICCNGAVDELIHQAARQRRDIVWRRGIVTFGVRSLPDGTWLRSGTEGRLVFGPFMIPQPPTPAESSFIKRCHDDVLWATDMVFRAREKWLLNTVLNTLCAVHRLPRNGDVLAHSAELERLFAEAFDLGATLWGPWRFSRPVLFEHLIRTIQDTASNENSMARDIRLGRPTESPWLAGIASDPQRWPSLVRYEV